MSVEQPLSDERIVKAFLRRVEARQADRQREKRMAASRHAKASVSLSGFTVSAGYEAAVQLYDDGRITFEQLLEAARTVQADPATGASARSASPDSSSIRGLSSAPSGRSPARRARS